MSPHQPRREIWGHLSGDLGTPYLSRIFGNRDDGNLTDDTLWSYTCDGENRLGPLGTPYLIPARCHNALNLHISEKCGIFIIDGNQPRFQATII
jgi:hypothetical protein